MQTLSELLDMAKRANGKARNRTIGQPEALDILELVKNATPETHTIRVYSRQGFVANAYRYPAEIRYFEATRDKETGKLRIFAATTDAKRSHGTGALITINGKAKG